MKSTDRPLRLLSVGAHPADIFDQSGGTMAHHTERGDHVACAVLTHGARIHDREVSDRMFHREQVPDSDELVELMKERSDGKAQEVRRACELLGAQEPYFMDIDDAVLRVEDDHVRRLARLLRSEKPDLILTHFPRELDGFTNPHAIAGQIVLHAIQLAASVDPGDRNPPHKVAQVFFFGTGAAHVRRNVWESEGGYYNDVFIDIEDVVDKKLAALDCLDSQGYAGAYARKRIETSDGAFGAASRCAYAEGFIRMNHEVHHALPVTPRALELAAESDHEVIERMSRRYDPEKG
jgi:4-oxalomesaconate hydratase